MYQYLMYLKNVSLVCTLQQQQGFISREAVSARGGSTGLLVSCQSHAGHLARGPPESVTKAVTTGHVDNVEGGAGGDMVV